jgi:hypothetical protein
MTCGSCKKKPDDRCEHPLLLHNIRRAMVHHRADIVYLSNATIAEAETIGYEAL